MAALVILSMLGSLPAVAQAAGDEPAHDATGALTDQARALHVEGVEHFRRGDYPKAYAAFSAAWGVKKHYQIAGALGACELKVGKPRDAAEHLHYFLEHFPAEGDAGERSKTRALLNEAKSKIVQLTIKVSPADATITVNGRQAQNDKPGFYEPGSCEVHANKYDYESTTATHPCEAGTARTITLALKPAAVQQPAPQPQPVVPSAGPDARLVAGIAVGVGALAGIAMGIGTTVVAAGHADEARMLSSDVDHACFPPASGAHCAELADAAAAHDRNRDLATGGFVAGGVLAGASAGLLLWWALAEEPESSAPVAVTVLPAWSPRHTGLILRGAW